MPWNGSGTYLTPTGQPVVTGTVISSTTFNNLVTDLAAAFNNTLPRDGQAPMTAQFKAIDGTVTLPGISFNAEQSTGLYRAATGIMGFTSQGVEYMRSVTGRLLIGTTSDDGTSRLQVNGPLKVAGNSTITGNSSITGTESVTGNITSGGTITATTSLYTSGTVTATGAITTSASMTISPPSGGSQLTIVRASQSTGQTNITFNGGTGSTTWSIFQGVNGNDLGFYSSGTASVPVSISASTGGVTLANGLSVGGGLGVAGAATLSSTLGVTGATTLSSTLGVTGAVTLSSTLFVTSTLTSNGPLNALGVATVGSSLSVGGATTLSSTLGVTGAITSTTQTLTGSGGIDTLVAQASTSGTAMTIRGRGGDSVGSLRFVNNSFATELSSIQDDGTGNMYMKSGGSLMAAAKLTTFQAANYFEPQGADTRLMMRGGAGSPTKSGSINFSTGGGADPYGMISLQRRAATGDAFESNLMTIALSTGNVNITNTLSVASTFTTYGSGNFYNTFNWQSSGGTYSGNMQWSNASSGATNPNKYWRINPSGGLELANSAYTTIIFSIADNGAVASTSTFTGTGFVVSSAAALKDVQGDLDGETAFQRVMSWLPKVYSLKAEDKKRLRSGLIVEEAPKEITDGDGHIDMYAMITELGAAVQYLARKVLK